MPAATIGKPHFLWSQSSSLSRRARLATLDGDVDPSELDVIWWRRAALKLKTQDATQTFAEANAFAATVGALLGLFRGNWISSPVATLLAENKISQLTAARDAGLVVPETLVSQNPEAVEAFRNEGPTIVKALATVDEGFMTVDYPVQGLERDRIAICPTIYQRKVSGRRHLRVNCFGSRYVAFAIETDDLDWRQNLDGARVWQTTIDSLLHTQLQDTMRRLNLAMGIFDLKESSDGELFWLEVNPQGQFLFWQEMTGVDMAQTFAEFLYSQARLTG